MRCSNSEPASGFTLIEVLVSITLMAMIATVVLSAMRSGLSTWDRGEGHLEALRRSRVVLDILNDQIRGALPITYTTKIEDRIVTPLAFEGNQSSLRFVTRSSFKDGPDGIARWVSVGWVHDPQAAAGELRVEERRILPPANLPDAAISWSGTVLNAEQCSFAFLTDAPQASQRVWVGEWRYPANPGLPKAVRLNCLLLSKATVQSILPLDYTASFAAGLVFR